MNMDGQDIQDYSEGVSTVLSPTIACIPTPIPPNPLPGSWITSNAHPITDWVRFPRRSLSSS